MNITIIEAFKRSVERAPGKPAVICGDQSWSYAEFDRLTDALASHLLAAGIRPGERIAFHLLNVPELALGYIGCLKAGAIAVPIFSTFRANVPTTPRRTLWRGLAKVGVRS